MKIWVTYDILDGKKCRSSVNWGRVYRSELQLLQEFSDRMASSYVDNTHCVEIEIPMVVRVIHADSYHLPRDQKEIEKRINELLKERELSIPLQAAFDKAHADYTSPLESDINAVGPYAGKKTREVK